MGRRHIPSHMSLPSDTTLLRAAWGLHDTFIVRLFGNCIYNVTSSRPTRCFRRMHNTIITIVLKHAFGQTPQGQRMIGRECLCHWSCKNQHSINLCTHWSNKKSKRRPNRYIHCYMNQSVAANAENRWAERTFLVFTWIYISVVVDCCSAFQITNTQFLRGCPTLIILQVIQVLSQTTPGSPRAEYLMGIDRCVHCLWNKTSHSRTKRLSTKEDICPEQLLSPVRSEKIGTIVFIRPSVRPFLRPFVRPRHYGRHDSATTGPIHSQTNSLEPSWSFAHRGHMGVPADVVSALETLFTGRGTLRWPACSEWVSENWVIIPVTK